MIAELRVHAAREVIGDISLRWTNIEDMNGKLKVRQFGLKSEAKATGTPLSISFRVGGIGSLKRYAVVGRS